MAIKKENRPRPAFSKITIGLLLRILSWKEAMVKY